MIKNNKTRLATIFLIIVLTILVGTIYVQAKKLTSIDELLGGQNIGNEIRIGRTNNNNVDIALYNNENLYCIQANTYLHDNPYRVEKYVKIEGNVATDNTGKRVQSRNNGILAYILGGGGAAYGRGYGTGPQGKTPRQYALWLFWNKWSSTVGDKLGVNWSHEGNDGVANPDLSKQLKREAIEYSKSRHSNAAISIVGSDTVVTSVATNTFAGPFKVKYTGTVTEVIVKDTDDQVIPSRVGLYKDKDGTQRITDVKDLPSGQNFYIKNGSGKNIKSVTVKVKSDEMIVAEIWFLRNGRTNTQRLIATQTTTGSTEASVTINVKPFGSLTIKKVDKDTGNSIKGAKFIVKTAGGDQEVSKWKWLSGEEGSYNYNAKRANAKVFTTDENGIIEIKGLKYGSYRVYEVGVPSPYKMDVQPGFDPVNNWVRFTKDSSLVVIEDRANHRDIKIH